MTSTYKHDIVTSISQSLKMRVNRALYGGSKLPHHLFRWNIIIDPGIGFAKTVDQNFKLLSHLRSLCIGTSMSEGIDGSSSSSLAVSTTITTFPSSNTASTSSAPELSQGGYFYTGFPILVGPSRKGFIGKTLGADDPKDSRRVWGTGAACTAAIAGGAAILRVHDVREMSDVVAVADKCFK